MSEQDASLDLLASKLGHALREQGRRLALAESCTGGWIAKVATDIAGSSAWFERGFVTYSNEAKQEMLGVPAAALLRHGAVSEPVVRAMAEGALLHSHADVAVAVSGIAGPDGGSEEKPVGTVWFAWACRGQPTRTERKQLVGDREEVRRQSVAAALAGLLKLLRGFEEQVSNQGVG